MKLFRRIVFFAAIAMFAVYSLYWLMFLSYLLLALVTPGGWKLWFDIGTQEGVAGPIFFWFLTLINPATLIVLYARYRHRQENRNPGV